MDDSLSYAVILAVADAEGADPTDLSPLSDAIDPEALDLLLSKNESQVRFNYHGYTVTVDHRGVVNIESVNSKPSQGRKSVDAHRVMETAREGMSLVRSDGTFAFVNSAFANLFGYNRHELLGEHWTVLYHEGEAKRLEEDILPAVRETGYWSGETVRLTKHGEPRVTDHRLALTDEDVILCTATDITLDRTASGLDARDFDGMVDNMEESAFFTLDHEGYVTRWNEETGRLEGYEPCEILGEHVSKFFPDEDRDQGLPERLLETAKNQGRVTDEGWRVRNDGTQFWADMTMVASYDDAGTIRGFGTVISETSELSVSS
ncbi:PAS domain S-box protein [Natrinema ejinorense]|uniref:PAS domain-containing protein n=1 Tax=Natrinema ejinorense TaxID=373386 RepID=A0A2A5QUR3_9EURY|nr:PAS domain S-box protein [Natrinema ejinorense]PCR90581.1 hypothetical protein CP557_08685 [Natrinema ejinorense]